MFNDRQVRDWRRYRLPSLALLISLAMQLAAQAASAGDNVPTVVMPGADGSLHLPARHARGVGPRIEYMPEWHAFGWFTADDRVEWQVANVQPGRYEVNMSWSVSDKEAGKPFVIEAGEYQLERVVEKTGSWETFVTASIGTLCLDADIDVLVFRPASHFPTGALLDLRELVLVPVD